MRKKEKRKTDCWVWPYSVNGNGYGSLGKNKKVIDAHKFMYEQIVGKIPANCELDHLCNNKLCVNPSHLEPVSHAENCRRGKQTKLTRIDVKCIRQLSATLTQTKIANMYGVSRQSIGLILQGKRWV